MAERVGLEAQVAKLAEQVDELQSRIALRDLVTDYCLGFDRHDWDLFLSIWHPDAVWKIEPPFGTFYNHDGIHKAVFEVLYPLWRETHHLTTNLRVKFKDRDHAHGICNVDCMGATMDNVVQMINATYTDEFERRNNVWKIAKRTVDIHYFNAVPGAQMTPP